MRRLALVALAVLALPGIGHAATPTAPVYDEAGRLVDTPFAPAEGAARLTEAKAVALFVAAPKVRDWLDRYPPKPTTDAEYESATGDWTVKVWSGEAGQVALGRVDDLSGRIEEAWTGPQVAWKMARGGAGAFGGKTLNEPLVWLAFCAVFLVALVDWRRPFTLRTVDLLALLSFTISLRFFNEGDIFTSVPLAYPPLLWLLGRMLWIGVTGRAAPGRVVWPVWVLAGAAVFLAGFRVGLNVEARRTVIDVGYASVIGAQRITTGEMPYGHMPAQGSLEPCGPAAADGEIRERIQTNGRCESSNERGDTYGPVTYLAYVPGVLAFGWSGKWDALPAAHATSILFDLLTIVGLALVGLRFGGTLLAATLACAWAAYPFTQYVSNTNSNDAVMPALLVWGFWLASSAWARGAAVALAGWTKFAALLLAPLWLTYPDGLEARRLRRFGLAFAGATAVAFSVLLLEPDPVHAARVFAERTLGFQLDRESPFSLWGWGQYHAAGIPDLHVAQSILQVLVVGLAVAVAFVPRRKTPLQLAALTGAVLIGFELVLTHWFYLYVPWFFPFVAIALFLAAPRREPA